jgi:hypothetical protein
MKTIEIKNRWNGTTLFACEITLEVESTSYGQQLGFVVKKALASNVRLSGASLSGASLSGANLSRADLSYADLSGAGLSVANLSRANLRGAAMRDVNLRGADLRGANLLGAILSGADLRGADLSGVDLSRCGLSGANLSGADLSGADLSRANLSTVKQDFLAEVLHLPNELEALKDALLAGQVDGSIYSGSCACLAGTLAKAHGISNYSGGDINLGNNIVFHANPESPRELFFTAIRPGDTPEKNGAARIALQWTEEAIAIRDMIRATAPT